jgi:phosphoribosylanthranilate isomerase
MRVKVCGITNLYDAMLAIEMGAWGLGFNFYKKSARYISPLCAEKIIRCLPETLVKVGVFVNETAETILATQQRIHADIIQLHGNESAIFCDQIPHPVVKAIRPKIPEDLKILADFSNLYAILVDAQVGSEWGGTGVCADWQLACEISRHHPTILAGGLHADNVLKAVTTVKPFAVDVCSGVESSPGRKSRAKLNDFFNILSPFEVKNG